VVSGCNPWNIANSRFAGRTQISFGPRLAVQRGWRCVLQTNTVPTHRVGPGIEGISNGTELGHGLETLILLAMKGEEVRDFELLQPTCNKTLRALGVSFPPAEFCRLPVHPKILLVSQTKVWSTRALAPH
jgi:hypothetical protein